MKLSDIDLEFTATKAGFKKNNLNPEKWWLVRYQLMEILVRIALKKFTKPTRNERISKVTPIEAVSTLFEVQLLPHFKKHNCNKWRKEFCWVQEVDEAFQDHLDEVHALFDKFSGKYSKPGKNPFMSLDEFSTLITNSSILEGKSIGSGEVGSLFNVAMMTQVKELDNERHMEMGFLEFVEAICRVAFKIQEFPEKYLPNRLRYQMAKLEPKSSSNNLDNVSKKGSAVNIIVPENSVSFY